jgi:GTP diphosphokinase / guanosine-3',5'-bis(diphosphate) 3'-diphosphatase
LQEPALLLLCLSEYIDNEQISLDFVRANYGDKIAELLEGLQKISSIKTDKSASQAENLRNLILTLASDVRVILIKLAERLYVMRNLEHISEDERVVIASETSYIYSPLAHRLGLYNMMSEMEDITMKYVEPEAYKMIEQNWRQPMQQEQNSFVNLLSL